MKSPESAANKKLREPRQFNGLALVIAIVREADPAFRLKILEKLRGFSPIFARLAEHTSFIYRDIPRLDDRGIQLIFSVIPEKEWLIAWKLTDERTRLFLLKNMSERRRSSFMMAYDSQPKILKRRVYFTQAIIARKIQQMLEHGKLGLRSRRLRDRIPG